MAIEHSLIGNSDLHEPKDVSAAGTLSGQVYVADGAGSGAWAYPGTTLHAATSVTGNATAIAGGSGTPQEWTPTWTSVDADGVTITGNSFVITAASSYFVQGCFSVQGTSSGVNIYQMQWAVNGTPVGQASQYTTNAASEETTIPVQAYLNGLSASDTVKLYVNHASSTDTILITDASMFIFGLG